MPRKFSRFYSIRYDECNLQGQLAPAAALRYMQDIAGLDSAEAPLPEDSLWVAKRTVLEFFAPVPVRSELEIVTHPMGFTKVTALRAYNLYVPPNPDPFILGRTLWVYLDAKGRPRRLPEMVGQFWLPEGNLAQREEEPFPPFPQTEPFIYQFKVPLSYLDVMAHVNNTKYVELLDDAAWTALQTFGVNLESKLVPSYYAIEYLESATLDEDLTVQTWFEPSPSENTRFSVIHQIQRGSTNVIRAHSRWHWHP
jgi:acyl-CoA thioesterase FadM